MLYDSTTEYDSSTTFSGVGDGSSVLPYDSITLYDSLATYDLSAVHITQWPVASDVRLGVTYGPTGTEYTGTMAEGGGSYPTAESIAAAVLAALQATTIPVNNTLINGAPVIGDGSEANPWRGAGVSP